MSKKFKVGDKLRVIDPSGGSISGGTSEYKRGEIVFVSYAFDASDPNDGQMICCEGKFTGMFSRRFELVEESPQIQSEGRFKVGDVVKCIDNTFVEDELELGKEYTVVDATDPDLVSVTPCAKSGGYFSYRFKLAEQKTTVADMVAKVKESLPEQPKELQLFTFSIKLSNEMSGANIQSDNYNVSKEEVMRVVEKLFEIVEGK